MSKSKGKGLAARALAKAGRAGMLGRKALLQKARRVGGGGRDKETLLVCGMMRSGTNMVMDVLERSDDTEVFHERDARAFDDYIMRDATVIHQLIDSSNAPCVVVKALLEAHRVKDLMAEFAPARALWVYRDLDDNVNSQLKSFSSTPNVMRRMATDPDYRNWRTEGLSDAQRALLKEHYREDCTPATAAALYWLVRNLAYFEQGLDQRDDVYLFRYEDGVSDPTREFCKLFQWLGLPWSDRLTRHVFASSISKRPPSDIDPRVREVCQEVTQRFDTLYDAQNRKTDTAVT